LEAAFLPGYPLLVAAVCWPLSGVAGSGSVWALPLATLLACNLSLLAALILLWRLYRPRLGPAATAIGLCLLLSWPSAFFLSVGYSESTFLAASAGSLMMAERRRWGWAGALGGAACLVRLPGLFLIVPLAMILWD